MTIDSVVMRTAITLGLVILTGALTWVFLPEDLVSQLAWIGGALVGAGLGLALSFMRVCSPPLVAAVCRRAGILPRRDVGGVRAERLPGHRDEAVVGTMAAFIATLAAYKFFNIQVTSRLPEVASPSSGWASSSSSSVTSCSASSTPSSGSTSSGRSA